MKVVFVTIPDRGLRVGGVRNKINQIYNHLLYLGVNIKLYSPWEDSLQGADICHVFQAHPSCYPFCLAARERGVRLVLSPIINLMGMSPWVMRYIINNLGIFPGVFVNYRLIKNMLKWSDAILPLSEDEKSTIIKSFPDLWEDRFHIVPNGSEGRFAKATPEQFINKYGFRPDVLFVGGIYYNKNLLSLIRALKATNLKLAVVGSDEGMGNKYYDQCLKEGKGFTTFCGRIPHESSLLASAYAASKVFVLPSFAEVFPNTVLEAGLAGCRIVLTNNNAMNDLLKDHATYVDPRDIDQIRNAILAESQKNHNGQLSIKLVDNYTWHSIAAKILSIYKLILNKRN